MTWRTCASTITGRCSAGRRITGNISVKCKKCLTNGLCVCGIYICQRVRRLSTMGSLTCTRYCLQKRSITSCRPSGGIRNPKEPVDKRDNLRSRLCRLLPRFPFQDTPKHQMRFSALKMATIWLVTKKQVPINNPMIAKIKITIHTIFFIIIPHHYLIKLKISSFNI